MTVPGRSAGLARDRVLLALGGYLLAIMVWYLVAPLPWNLRVLTYWLIQPSLDVVVVVAALRASRIVGLSRPARRFFRGFAAGVVCITVADFSQAVAALLDPDRASMEGDPAQNAVFFFGVAVIVGTIITYPVGNSPGRGRVRFWLDAGTVLIAAGVLAMAIIGPGASVADLLPAGLILLAALAAVKLLLSSHAPMTRAAAVPMLAAGGLYGLATYLFTVPAFATHPVLLALCALPSALFVVGPRIQELQMRARNGPVPPKERHYSLLPYLMIAVAFGALATLIPVGSDARIWLGLAGLLAMAALVVTRQLLGFQESRMLQDKLRHQASHDALTGLANRTLFADRLAAARGYVALIDLDDFKVVHDRLGHGVGDALLVEVADRLRAGVRPGDLVARLGGDEFALLLAGATADEADAVTERIAGTLQHPICAGGHELLVQASVGLADVAQPGTAAADPAEALRRADVAMYAAKEQGKSRYVRYEPGLDRRNSEDARLGAQLRLALDEDTGLHLVYQPIVRLPDGEHVGVEALVRWQHPERGLVPPDVFVPLAERNGLILPLGRRILELACEQAVGWTGRMSVNVSARQLRDPDFAEQVAAVLAATGLAAHRLVIEVTETAVFDGGTALDTLHAVHGLGVGVALDDFGTGHSSLGLLRTCPVDILKVDRSFVSDITARSEQAVIASALIDIAGGLDLMAVAEGVETAEQADRLYALGYRYAQGYHFARPMLPADLLSLTSALTEPAILGR